MGPWCPSYHRQYEKSALLPSPARTILRRRATTLVGGPAFGSPLTLRMRHGRPNVVWRWARTVTANVACDFFATAFRGHQSVTFSRISIVRRRSSAPREFIMIGLVRAATLCATLALGLVSAQAADKAFKRDDLADSAIKLEAQIKSEAGPVAKSAATLRTDADAAFKRGDYRVGLQITGQIAAVAPEDSGNWLRLARTIFQIRSATQANRPSCMSAPRPPPISPTSAPAMPARRPMRSPCSAGRCPNASCGVRRWIACGSRST